MASDAAPTQTTVTLMVEGMTCGNCVRHIEKALQKHFGELPHRIDLPGGTMTISFDPSRLGLAAIAAVMSDEGYPVTPA